MSKTVWKYPVNIARVVKIDMPKYAKVLFAAVQHGTPCFWVEVDPDQPTETRFFRIYGTGHLMPHDTGRYIGTFIVDNGNFVFHAYE